MLPGCERAWHQGLGSAKNPGPSLQTSGLQGSLLLLLLQALALFFFLHGEALSASMLLGFKMVILHPEDSCSQVQC